MAKGKGDLVSEAAPSKSQARQRAKAAALIDPGFLTQPAAAAQRTRNTPADALQVSPNMAKDFSAGTQGSEPTAFARGGRVKMREGGTTYNEKLGPTTEKEQDDDYIQDFNLDRNSGAVRKADGGKIRGARCMKCGGMAHGGPCKKAEGGKMGSDEAQDAGMVKRGVHQHEANMHKGSKETVLKLKAGGRPKMKLKLKKGALHREMGIPQGQKIPEGRLEAKAHSDNPLSRKRAQFAINASKWNHKAEGGSVEMSPNGPRNNTETGARKGPSNAQQQFAVGGVAKIRHNEATSAGKQKAPPPSRWGGFK